MKALNLITLILTIVGGLNWGLVAIGNFDIVAAIFGADTGATRVVYALIGLSALWQLVPFFRAIGMGETSAEANVKTASR